MFKPYTLDFTREDFTGPDSMLLQTSSSLVPYPVLSLDFLDEFEGAADLSGFAGGITISNVATPIPAVIPTSQFAQALALAAGIAAAEVAAAEVGIAFHQSSCGCGHTHAGEVDKGAIAEMAAMIQSALDTGVADIDGLIDAVADMSGASVQSVKDHLDTVAAEYTGDPQNEGPVDLPADTTTQGVIEVGGSVTGTRENGSDEDWFAVELEAGVEYIFFMLRAGENPHQDPYLYLYDSAGTQLEENDDIDNDGDGQGDNRNSSIYFTPAESGTYYLGASGYATFGGDYEIFAEVSTDRPDFTLEESAFFLTDQFSNRLTFDPNVEELTYDITTLEEGAQNLALIAMQLWSEATNITFRAAEEGETVNIFYNDDVQPNLTAFARTTGTEGGFKTTAEIVIPTNWELIGFEPDYNLNSYRFSTYLHEIGHVLGLGHSGPYNGTSSDAATGRSFHLFNQDAWNYSIMSYRDQSEAGTGTFRETTGLLLVDYIAIQSIYGANTETRTGDSTYGFNTTEAGSVYDFQTQYVDEGFMAPSLTIYDAGGIDTLDASGYNTNQTINLNGGTFSSIGDNTRSGDITDALVNNISIDVTTVIENATTGLGADTLIGNDADNVLNGGGGGGDTYQGGGGTDTVVLSGARDSYTITQETIDGVDYAVLTQGGFSDRVRLDDIELIKFGDDAPIALASLFGPSFTEGADTVEGTAADDTLLALGGDDTVLGLGGNDALYGQAGSDTLNGGTGDDLLVGDNAYSLAVGGIGGIEGEVYRAYQAVFGRDPDEGGYDANVNAIRLNQFTSLQMLEGFTESPEFVATYGELSNAEFVNLLYVNVLPGNNDQVGRAAFTAELDAGNQTRAQVVQTFANSQEFINNTAAGTSAFVENVAIDPIGAQVYRLYTGVLGRQPDAAGFELFTGALQIGALTVQGVVNDFVGSAEFADVYGELTNAEFIELLYDNVLPGNEDPNGRAAFTAELDAGNATRAEVVLDFVNSFDYRSRTTEGVESFLNNYNVGLETARDTLVAGSGNDMLLGGEGVDTFLFSDGIVGVNTIMDFTSGVDVIDLSGVSQFANFDALLAAASQVGADTVIATTNQQSIVLSNVQLSDLTADDFVFASVSSAEKPADDTVVSELPSIAPVALNEDFANDDAVLAALETMDQQVFEVAAVGPDVEWLQSLSDMGLFEIV